MNTNADFSAKEVVNSYSADDLARVFRQYGELKNAGSLGRAIAAYREKNSLNAIRDLLEAISDCMPRHNENQYLAKVFQSIRIEVNREIEYLKELLVQTAEALVKGGRMAVISYHSLEDRLVKNFMRTGGFGKETETDLFGNIIRPLVPVTRQAVRPDEEEIMRNNRARSARLRIAEKQ